MVVLHEGIVCPESGDRTIKNNKQADDEAFILWMVKGTSGKAELGVICVVNIPKGSVGKNVGCREC